MAAEKASSSKGQAWFCTTGLPSDVVIEVDDMTFHLHKVLLSTETLGIFLFIFFSCSNLIPNSVCIMSVDFQFPLMSKSKRLHELITEQETNPTATRVQNSSASAAARGGENDGQEEIEEEEEQEAEEDAYFQISLPEFPGGSEAFETAAKFCYGVKIELSSSNVAPLRCAGEVLEMTEEYSEDNLISRTERFLSQSVLKSIKDSIRTLKSCERLMPLAETLGIVQRCIDSIAARASASDPSLFGWPVNEKAGNGRSTAASVGAETLGRRKTTGADSWFDELALLNLPLYKRLIFALKARDLSPEIIENCLIYYAKRYIPGISRSNRKPSSSSIPSESEQRELLETVIANLPLEKGSRSSTATRLLFGLLRTANILNVPEGCRAALEKKIGSQLEQATLDDLLIPSYSYLNETLYDVDCIERILGCFLEGLEERSAARIEGEEENSGVRSAALMLVGKLIDGYLSEIASDANLKPDKFYELAVSLPDHARLFDDGLYRAVDVYLKAHPSIPDPEREKICGVIDCQKLTLEACTHAAQNERLPLRAVIQVLFFEQLQLRQAIAGTLQSADVGAGDIQRTSNPLAGEDEVERGVAVTGDQEAAQEGESNTWRSAVRENQMLRLDMDSMRSRVQELERECSSMRRAIEKIEKPRPKPAPRGAGGGSGGWRGSLSKSFGCKFKTQVCDSHEPTVVEARKGRPPHHPHHQ